MVVLTRSISSHIRSLQLRDSVKGVRDISEQRIFGGVKPDIELAVSQIAQGAE